MIRKWTTAAAALMLALTMGGAATAQVNVRQLNQERRIDAGRRSGKLTNAERNRLYMQQHAIERLTARRRAMHGGHLTAADKRMIHARQRQANRDILRLKHNSHRGKNHLRIHL